MNKLFKIIAILILFATTSVHAADTKVSALTDIVSPTVSDDMYIVDNPDVTPVSKKINIGALLGVAADLDSTGAIVANGVALTTDTTGNYVGTVAAGTGITIAEADGEGVTKTVVSTLGTAIDTTEITDGTVDQADIDDTDTLAGNPAHPINSIWFATTGLIAEGSTGDAIETLLTFADPTVSDKTITFPDETGTVITSATTLAGDVGGTTGATTVDSVQANSVTLATDTVGNFVASITNGSGITGGDAGSEGAALTLAATLGTAITSSEITDNEILEADLNVTNTPTDNFVLSYNAAGSNFTWAADAGGAETNSLESVITGILNTEMLVGTGTDTANYVAMSGDVTMTNAGVTTIGADKVALTTNTTGYYAAGDAEAGNALTGDAAVDFFGAGVTAVTDATTCTDIEGTLLSITAGTLNATVNTADIADSSVTSTELNLLSGLTVLSGNNTGDQTTVSGNAGTVTHADAAGDTTTFVSLGTAATGSLAPATDAELTYNATTNALTAGSFVGNLTGNADTVTTNANLTGHVTSVGNATSLGSFTVAELNTAVSDDTIAGNATTNTFTNKTVDANGTGNTYTNFDEGNMLAGSDIVRSSIEFIIDGGGSVITTGVSGDIEVPFNCTIKRVTLLADTSGSIVVDIWKDTYVNYPPTVVDSITAAAIPTITTAVKSQDTTLTGWTTALTAGDILRYNVNSATTITRCTISLIVEK